jgi:thiol-disulfide isomerase/thioredoxin
VTELKAYAMIASMLGKNMKFLAVTKASTKEEVKAAYEKIKSLKLTLPVLLDEKGLLAYVMLTQRVPAYAIVTKSGRFTLARAGALTEKVDAKQTLLGMLTQVSRGGEPEFTMAPGYSPNPFNLVGQMAPELEVHELVGQGKWQLQNHVKKHNKPIVLVFWSLTCPHCRKIIPGVQQYISDNQKSVDVRSLIILHDKQHVEMLDVLRKEINLTMPVLNDPKGDAFNRYHIMTVPTFFVVDKSGKIIGAYIGGGKDVAKSIDQILKSGG